jgi:uncharacterized Zn finger protein
MSIAPPVCIVMMCPTCGRKTEHELVGFKLDLLIYSCKECGREVLIGLDAALNSPKC